MDQPIESAADLYREMRRRGLHLRRGNGRDDALIADLVRQVGCPDLRLQRFLDSSGMSAEGFLIAFLDMAQPFVEMYREIWGYLSVYAAPSASETLAIRFGFPDARDARRETLEDYRRHASAIQQVTSAVMVWPRDAIGQLYGLYRILLDSLADTPRPALELPRYQEGLPYQLPEVVPTAHAFDSIAVRLRRLFQRNIDAFVEERRAQELPFQTSDERHNDFWQESGAFPTRLLTVDLLPFWVRVFSCYAFFSSAAKDQAYVFFREEIAPLLQEGRGKSSISIDFALDIIDLPFWRHRWHTYEVWASVAVLRALEEYRPIPIVEDGRLPIDGSSAAVAARLMSSSHPEACVAVQVQTPFLRAKRKAIKPDLRVCYSEEPEAAETALIVEFKQRARMGDAECESLFRDYTDGSPNCRGMAVVNYDEGARGFRPDPESLLLEGFHPGNPQAISAFRRWAPATLEAAGIRPARDTLVVLLDVSGSMAGQYQDPVALETVHALISNKALRVHAFNDGLVAMDGVDAKGAGIATSGGTDLGRALRGLDAQGCHPDRLLLLTDGEYLCAPEDLAAVPDKVQCLPTDARLHVAWLLAGRAAIEKRDAPAGLVRIYTLGPHGTFGSLSWTKDRADAAHHWGKFWEAHPILIVGGRQTDPAQLLEHYKRVHPTALVGPVEPDEPAASRRPLDGTINIKHLFGSGGLVETAAGVNSQRFHGFEPDGVAFADVPEKLVSTYLPSLPELRRF